MRNELTVERLRERLSYDPESGIFTWRVAVGCARCRRKPGDLAGRLLDRGYRQIKIEGRQYLAHRLAVHYMTGAWPEHEVDHRDLDKSNNRWDNLRAATSSQNKSNTRRQRNNTSGFKALAETAA